MLADQIRDMFKPVRCNCGQVYDLGSVEVTARYTDCSVWRTPCCRRTVDDRGETGWTSRKDYEVIDKNNLSVGAGAFDIHGRFRWAGHS